MIVGLDHWVAPHSFMVVATETGPILGSDFLLDHGMVVDLKRMRLDWIGGSLQLQRHGQKKRQRCTLVLEEQLQTPGMECVVAMARVTNNEGESCPIEGIQMLEPSQALMDSTGALVARVLLAESTTRTPVQLLFMQGSKCLNKGTVLGTLIPVEECSQTEYCGSIRSFRCEAQRECDLQFLQQFDWSSTRLSPKERVFGQAFAG